MIKQNRAQYETALKPTRQIGLVRPVGIDDRRINVELELEALSEMHQACIDYLHFNPKEIIDPIDHSLTSSQRIGNLPSEFVKFVSHAIENYELKNGSVAITGIEIVDHPSPKSLLTTSQKPTRNLIRLANPPQPTTTADQMVINQLLNSRFGFVMARYEQANLLTIIQSLSLGDEISRNLPIQLNRIEFNFFARALDKVYQHITIDPLLASANPIFMEIACDLYDTTLPDDVSVIRQIQKSIGIFNQLFINTDTQKLEIHTVSSPVKVMQQSPGGIPILHDPTGPAVEYSDGFHVGSLNGWATPVSFIENPKDTDLDTILKVSEDNIANAYLTHYGFEHLVSELPYKVIDDDVRRGRLIKIKPLRAAWMDISLLEVLDPSKNEKVYLRVPNSSKTAQAAAAWTFNLPANKYRPDVES